MAAEEVAITFHKGGAKKQDTVVIESARQKHILKAWRQGIIPHEMVHYAVEKVFDDLRGFIRFIGDGVKDADVLEKGGVEALYSEALVNVFQQELFGVLPPGDATFLDYFNEISRRETKFSKAPDFFEYAPDKAKIELARELLRELTERWNNLPEGEEIKFSLSL
ncbi:MAG TPA: hypothetical protein VK400_13520 [Pyrinomonadaceae bacterium]|nr:hypothetical protein [Pyrinomonadaceae bacterium]